MFKLLQMQFQEIEKSRISIEQQKYTDRVALQNKLKIAANARDENMKKMLDRLKEHVSWRIANQSFFICNKSSPSKII